MSADIWKWISGALLTAVVFLAGHLHAGVSREEVKEMVANGINSAANPYVADREAIRLQLSANSEDLKAIKDQLLRLSIAMGVQPDGTVVVRKYKGN